MSLSFIGNEFRSVTQSSQTRVLHEVAFLVDFSQSPYFSEGFSRPLRFDGTAAILFCKSEHDLGRVSKLPRGGEGSWEAAGKNASELLLPN